MPYDPRMAVADSPLAAALERVGDKWSLLLIESLLSGPLRFNELQASVTGIAPNILSDRLRRLEGERVVSRPASASTRRCFMTPKRVMPGSAASSSPSVWPSRALS